MTMPAVLPFQRPRDFGPHGVHRLVHCAGSGLVKALMHHHRWTKGRSLVWVQWFYGHGSRLWEREGGKEGAAIGANCRGGMAETKGWDCIADYLDGDNLLQVPVQVGGGGVTMTWVACWRLWGEKFALTCDLVWKEGSLGLRNWNVLKGALSEMGSALVLPLLALTTAHKGSGFVVTLWDHLLVDHMCDSEGMGHPVRNQWFEG